MIIYSLVDSDSRANVSLFTSVPSSASLNIQQPRPSIKTSSSNKVTTEEQIMRQDDVTKRKADSSSSYYTPVAENSGA